MKVVATIRLYGYMDTNTINKRKRDVIICKQKVKKKDNSVQRASVVSTRRCTVHGHKYSSPSIVYCIFHIKPHFFKIIF